MSERITLVRLRHEEIKIINSFCETDRQKMWTLGDCFYDWNRFAKMKKNEVLILKIHKGGTHLFPLERLYAYKEVFTDCIYLKVTSYEDRIGKEDYDGDDYTIEPFTL